MICQSSIWRIFVDGGKDKIMKNHWFSKPSSYEQSQFTHWTFRPYPPIVKYENDPSVLAKKSKLPPNVFIISDSILIYGEVYIDGQNIGR